MTFTEQKELLTWARANRVAAIKLGDSEDGSSTLEVTFYPQGDETMPSAPMPKGWDQWVDKHMGLNFEPVEHPPTTIERSQG